MSEQTLPDRRRVKAEPSAVQHYTRRKPAKHHAEMALVARAFPALPPGSRVLDAPCGAGRLSLWLAERDLRVAALDLGSAAVVHTRTLLATDGADAEVREGDVFALPWEDRAFQAVVCFRLLHHFQERARRLALVREMARVCDGYLLVSYLSPWSFTGLKRRLRAALGGRRHRQNHTSLSELVADLKAEGFQLDRDLAQRRFLHSLHLARFVRKSR
ncbi:class I SAM-dependent methyltransferase [Alloalcanivorax sp. C16-2]|uniref:class I SAM-dependent methyltransferase n=1 Tax=Alloalcanivorax TaxID=3020832 RepID=UPI0019335735|nr:class I SAM-dependent methyltransferase [Alloalcanivorax marinus]MBL7250805.1 class I SAM-dependent methyltransferase [Alloalcanivorax marinus]MCH2558560.1 class I SAM-dependent methyltransferase [Alcanivorax sp.]